MHAAARVKTPGTRRAKPGVSLAQLVKAGTLVYAKREFLNHQKYSAAEGGDSESALLRSGSGVAGVVDARIQAAYQVMANAKVPNSHTDGALPRERTGIFHLPVTPTEWFSSDRLFLNSPSRLPGSWFFTPQL